MLPLYEHPAIEEIHVKSNKDTIALALLREDKIHPEVSGNKWRKLKYNLIQAREDDQHTLLTFGGAYSNHIYATAAAAREAGFRSIGIIRGEEHLPLNNTMAFAREKGMQLSYMDRSTYRRKTDPDIINYLRCKWGEFYLIPEGGTNKLAIKGCEEIVTDAVRQFDQICLPVGTGGTIAGVVSGMQGTGRVLGFSSLKGDFLQDEVTRLLQNYDCPFQNWSVNHDYHFGGYAKVTALLMDFIDNFYQAYGVQLDPVYTGKMMYGIFELIRAGYFPKGAKILAIHTGGLQGLKGFTGGRL